MHIIVVSNRLATAKTVTLTGRHLLLAGLALMGGVLVVGLFLAYLSLHFRLPVAEQMLTAVREHEAQKRETFLRDNVNAMALRLGQLQAQVLRLDSMSERLMGLAGVKSGEKVGQGGAALKPLDALSAGGQGGPLVLARPAMSLGDLHQELDRFSERLDVQSEQFSLLESELLARWAEKSRLPTVLPVNSQWNASTFGWRIDPFTGARALHEGVDFVAGVGTEIVAAAGGVVIAAELHPQYGNMVEIDHGNGLTTRYAHCSKLAVREGQVVKPGEHIAEVGTTGRSTGPHLHFEVRMNGVAQNPNRFLERALPRLAQR